MAVAKTNKDDQWELIGILTFLDPPRPDTKHTIDKSMEFGVDVKMVCPHCFDRLVEWNPYTAAFHLL